MKSRATAFAPASVANVAVGFDLLGFSVSNAGDEVTVERIEKAGVEIKSVSGLTQVPKDATKNTATAGLLRLVHDLHLNFGFEVTIKKGIPLGSGMGGSAASSVAALVAANSLLEKPISEDALLSYALIGEAQASGSYHGDNVAPSLKGGLTLARVRGGKVLPRIDVISLPVPKNVFCVLVHPQLILETKAARGILKPDLTLKTHVEQSANLAGFMAACFRNDLALLKASFTDVAIEPQRSHLIPGFQDVRDSAMKAGALGCSISGAGPSVFAWVHGEDLARDVEKAMIGGFARAGLDSKGWTMPLECPGARIIS